MARVKRLGIGRATRPIEHEPPTPWEKEQRQLLDLRVSRTYQRAPQPTATSAAGMQRIAGVKIGGGGRITGNAGFKPESMPLRTNP